MEALIVINTSYNKIDMSFSYDPSTKDIMLTKSDMKEWFDTHALNTTFKIEPNDSGTEVLKMVFDTPEQEALFHLRWN